tara:strand:- start:87221 stop:88759 length:1539 start_codon:yes stop_codon:yes gene_type:complete
MKETWDIIKKKVTTPVAPSIDYKNYAAVIAYADTKGYTQPSVAQHAVNKYKFDSFIHSGLYAKMVAWFQFQYSDITLEDFSLINWIKPNDAALAIATGSPTYYTNGWGGANTESIYIDTNVILNDEVLFQMNDGSMAMGGASDDYGSYWKTGTLSSASPFFFTRQTRRWGGGTHQLGFMAGGNRDMFLNNDGVNLTAYMDNVLKNSNPNSVGAAKPATPFLLLGGTTNNRVRYWGCFSALTKAERYDLNRIITETYTIVDTTGYETEYIAVLDYAASKGFSHSFSQARHDLNNAMIANFKTEGIWTLYDRFYYFKYGVGYDDFCTIDWKDPTDTGLLTIHGNVVADSSGITGDGVSGSVIETPINMWTDSAYNQNDWCFTIKANNSGVVGGYNGGMVGGSGINVSLWTSRNVFATLDQADRAIGQTPSLKEMQVVGKNGTTTGEAYEGGVLVGTNSVAYNDTWSGLWNQPFWLLGRALTNANHDGTLEHFGAGGGALLPFQAEIDSIITGTY